MKKKQFKQVEQSPPEAIVVSKEDAIKRQHNFYKRDGGADLEFSGVLYEYINNLSHVHQIKDEEQQARYGLPRNAVMDIPPNGYVERIFKSVIELYKDATFDLGQNRLVVCEVSARAYDIIIEDSPQLAGLFQLNTFKTWNLKDKKNASSYLGFFEHHDIALFPNTAFWILLAFICQKNILTQYIDQSSHNLCQIQQPEKLKNSHLFVILDIIGSSPFPAPSDVVVCVWNFIALPPQQQIPVSNMLVDDTLKLKSHIIQKRKSMAHLCAGLSEVDQTTTMQVIYDKTLQQNIFIPFLLMPPKVNSMIDNPALFSKPPLSSLSSSSSSTPKKATALLDNKNKQEDEKQPIQQQQQQSLFLFYGGQTGNNSDDARRKLARRKLLFGKAISKQAIVSSPCSSSLSKVVITKENEKANAKKKKKKNSLPSVDDIMKEIEGPETKKKKKKNHKKKKSPTSNNSHENKIIDDSEMVISKNEDNLIHIEKPSLLQDDVMVVEDGLMEEEADQQIDVLITEEEEEGQKVDTRKIESERENNPTEEKERHVEQQQQKEEEPRDVKVTLDERTTEDDRVKEHEIIKQPQRPSQEVRQLTPPEEIQPIPIINSPPPNTTILRASAKEFIPSRRVTFQEERYIILPESSTNSMSNTSTSQPYDPYYTDMNSLMAQWRALQPFCEQQSSRYKNNTSSTTSNYNPNSARVYQRQYVYHGPSSCAVNNGPFFLLETIIM